MTADLLRDVLLPLLTAAATWGAIRADIRSLHEKVRDLRDDLKGAHQRIDRITSPRAR